MQKNPKTLLPAIPDKRYFTIGEASELCKVKPHVLRYWEQEFAQLRPTKRTGNRRYYQQKDIETVRKIRTLLYEEGFTISGAKTQLTGTIRENKKTTAPKNVRKLLEDIQKELQLVVVQLEEL